MYVHYLSRLALLVSGVGHPRNEL